jgi:hypothetical protein
MRSVKVVFPESIWADIPIFYFNLRNSNLGELLGVSS